MKNIVVAFLLISCIQLTGCIPSPYYQKEHSVPQNQWSYDFKPSFKFNISDTSAIYNLDFIIRHTEAYPFSNIWLWVYTKQPGDTTFQKMRLEIPLAEKTGKWLGRGMGEIWEQHMPVTGASGLFKKNGTYEIKLEHNMRINPLPDVLQVGLKLSKGDVENNKIQ